MSLARAAGLALLACAALAAACTPVMRRHGFVPEKELLSAIKPLEDTKTTVLARYGHPSTTGVFEADTWYYVTNVRQQLGYLKPESSARQIYAVRFNKDGLVQSVDNFELEDGRVVAMVDRKTPTRGRELTILEQLLGNVGRLPGETLGQENLPGGAGGPRRE